jgi:hypothetical protein
MEGGGSITSMTIKRFFYILISRGGFTVGMRDRDYSVLELYIA